MSYEVIENEPPVTTTKRTAVIITQPVPGRSAYRMSTCCDVSRVGEVISISASLQDKLHKLVCLDRNIVQSSNWSIRKANSFDVVAHYIPRNHFYHERYFTWLQSAKFAWDKPVAPNEYITPFESLGEYPDGYKTYAELVEIDEEYLLTVVGG